MTSPWEGFGFQEKPIQEQGSGGKSCVEEERLLQWHLLAVSDVLCGVRMSEAISHNKASAVGSSGALGAVQDCNSGYASLLPPLCPPTPPQALRRCSQRLPVGVFLGWKEKPLWGH